MALASLALVLPAKLHSSSVLAALYLKAKRCVLFREQDAKLSFSPLASKNVQDHFFSLLTIHRGLFCGSISSQTGKPTRTKTAFFFFFFSPHHPIPQYWAHSSRPTLMVHDQALVPALPHKPGVSCLRHTSEEGDLALLSFPDEETEAMRPGDGRELSSGFESESDPSAVPPRRPRWE